MRDRLEQPPLGVDRLTQAHPLPAHRVFAPCFGKTPQQLLVTRDEEQNLAFDTPALELLDQLWDRRDLVSGVTGVETDRRARVRRLGAAHRVRDERLEQR